uniref:Hypothetical chloroplast RF66 n=1 Tax=Cosmarium botrytis TaxID=33101 RepID=A0A191T5H2_9VIRI|nr:hypothetical chloroplast RF66 [Cosmarium botrytis]ANI25639.1 hypothetical chloroplast RF66 [Cosmarium botrytis]
MIHMELGPSTIVGVGLALIGFILYLVKTKKPDVSRDYDLFFSSVGLLCGGILIFQGWRLDPILLLCQILSSATAIFFIGESLWLRGAKQKNINLFSSEYYIGAKQKNTDNAPLELPSAGIQKTNEDFLSQDFLSGGPKGAKQRFFFSKQGPQEADFNFMKKKIAFGQSEIQRDASHLTETNHQSILNNKKRAYEEKKISLYYQVKKKYFDLDYTHPLDYCHTSFYTKD